MHGATIKITFFSLRNRQKLVRIRFGCGLDSRIYGIFYATVLLTNCRWMKSPFLHVCFPLLHIKEPADLHGLRYVHHSHSYSSDNDTEDGLLTACSLLPHVASDDHGPANLKTMCCPSLRQVEHNRTASYSYTKSQLQNEMPR